MKVTKRITRPIVEKTGARFTFKKVGSTLTESAHKRLKESSLRNYDFAGLNAELRATLPADCIDNHNSDLYVKKTPESTEILKKYGILGHHFCKTFSSQTPPLGIWYDIAFAYVPMKESLTEDTDEILVFKKDVQSAEDVDDIQYAIQKLSDGVAEDALQSAFNEAEGKDIDEVKNAVISALDVYLEDNEWLGEAVSNPERTIGKIDKNLAKEVDKDLVRDLTLCIENDGEVYRRLTTPVIANLKRKLAKGQFNEKLAIQAFFNVVESALRMPHFYQYYTYSIKSVSVPERYAVAKELLDGAMDEIEWEDPDTNESLKESSEDKPYSYKEVEQELKSLTNNFTQKSGELKCGFEEEKNHGVKILKKHYEIVEVSGDDRRSGTWYHIEFSNPKKKSVKESAPLEDRKPYRVFAPGDRVVLTSNKWHTDSQNDNIGRKGTIVRDYYHGAKHGFQVKADDVRKVSGYDDTGFNAYDDELDYAD